MIFGILIGENSDMYNLDQIDQKLISLLRHNARESIATLATRLGVSRGTVNNRLRRLEDAGMIVGYTVRLRPEADTGGLQAWMSIAIEGNDARRVTASLLGEPSVLALHATNGRWDLLAELQVSTLPELARALERIRLIKGISQSETSIHLETVRAAS
ncbi:transcriptional regulator, AsnC family [Pseudomonas sp. URIL14HWK12:I9]|nr:DNA-binding Lrp family transcriptional regulator [Pseudomonas sp. URIL14HWK12:I12]PVZ23977.1 DNA-binding Lrp family transcriptional regulator [Pseudomonas sp. URIL14HWK12:I10]PVZ33384.1 DNA-binding Lrp family transcriptional regulator [Pseudomonas sp. URIL14HWK12:I11]SNZ11366.1 transcriptional regulator, AsnC family [Pseudomonas sp. URIL14HWK12:I9]